jgi:hypothetical protein
MRASDLDLARGVYLRVYLVYMYPYPGSVGIGRGSRMRMSITDLVDHQISREQTETWKRTRADTAPDLTILI